MAKGLAFVCFLLGLLVETQAGYTCQAGSNPCTAANAAAGKFYFEYADSALSFVQCSQWGQCFVRPCAPGTGWSQSLQTCAWVPDTDGDCGEVIKPVGYTCEPDNNPCKLGITKLYYPYVTSDKFVQCSQWGQCHVMPCPPGEVWDDAIYTCNRPTNPKPV